MRPKARIPIFLDKVDWKQLLTKQWKIYSDEDTDIIDSINEEIDGIREFWLNNQDLRISQVLISCDIIPNIPGTWYYKEDKFLLIEQGNDEKDLW